MKQTILLLLIIPFFNLISYSQTASSANYVFATGTTGDFTIGNGGQAIIMSTGTTTLVGPGQTNFNSPITPLDFDFYLMGTRNNWFTVATNGALGLNANLTPGNNIAGGTLNRVGAFVTGTAGNDMATHATGKIHYKTFGTAPNRVSVFEYLNMSIPRSSTTADATFQVRVYETTGVVEFVYGNMNVSGTIGTANRIGFSSNSTTNTLATITSSTNAVSLSAATSNTYTSGPITNLNSPTEGSRRFYRFTPPAVANAPGITVSAPTGGSHSLSLTASSSTGLITYALYQQVGGTGPYNFFTTVGSASIPLNSTVVGLNPNTQYRYQLYAVSEGGVSPVATSSTITTMAPGSISSAGSGLWNSTTTWTGGVVPTSGDNVIITPGHTVTVDPGISTAYAYDLTIGTGSTVQFDDVSAGILQVGRDLVVNGTLNVRNSTTTGRTLNLGGNLVNNGSVDMAKVSTVLTCFGTTAQTISKSIGGVFVGTDVTGIPANAGIIRQWSINNTAGVILNTPMIVTFAINFTNGNLTTNGNLSLDNTQIATGVTSSASVTVNRIQSSSGFNGAVNVGSTATYNIGYNSSAALPIAQTNIIGGTELNNAIAIANGINNLSIGSTGGVTYTSSNLQVKGILTLSGNLSMGNRDFTLGASTTVKGSIAQSINGLINTTGTVTRWFDATALTIGTVGSLFPIGVADQNRSFWLSGTPTTGGTVAVKYNSVWGTTALTPYSENSVSYDIRTNSNWQVSTGNGFAGSTFGLRMRTANNGGITNFANINVSLVSGMAPGTFSAGTFANTEPEANRAGLSAANLTNNFYMAANSTENPLPVSYITFSGFREGNKNVLRWNTANEQNNKGFELQRSADGINFSTMDFIASLAINGNSAASLKYEYNDEKPLRSSNYYRLRQIDTDGKATVSNVVLIRGNGVKNVEISNLYPNPAINVLNMVVSAESNRLVNFVITDMTGKIVMQLSQQVATGDSNVQLQVGKLAAGSYTIKAVCNEGCESAIKQFIKR